MLWYWDVERKSWVNVYCLSPGIQRGAMNQKRGNGWEVLSVVWVMGSHSSWAAWRGSLALDWWQASQLLQWTDCPWLQGGRILSTLLRFQSRAFRHATLGRSQLKTVSLCSAVHLAPNKQGRFFFSGWHIYKEGEKRYAWVVMKHS